MGFPGEAPGLDLVSQWEANQATQGLPVDADPATGPVVPGAPATDVPEILSGLSVPPPPGGGQGLEAMGLPSHLGGSPPPVSDLNLSVATRPATVADLSGSEVQLAESHKLKCPKCDTVQSAKNKTCTNCGHSLGEARKAKFAKLDAGQDPAKDQGLELGMRISIHNDRWDDANIDPAKTASALLSLSHGDRLDLPMGVCAQRIDDSDGTLWLVSQGYDGTPLVARSDEAALASLQAALTAAKAREEAERAKYDNVRPVGASYDQRGEDEHPVSIYQRGLNLGVSEEPDDDGLIWKVSCKTGTLALSPGPGQTDAEVPLVLSRDLFDDMKESFEEKAFPYVTVPETHNNGSLENTGYVRKVDVLSREELLADSRLPERFRPAVEADPEDTSYLLSGIEFTEPDVKEKAQRGSIPDTSIGVKFNYRNKRSGKLFKAAYEHLALTPVPWVDGLIPFGLSQGPGRVFDQDEQVGYDGVYTDGIELSGFVEFDPKAHPRDIKGHWRKAVGGLGEYKQASLPDGTNVAKADGKYHVDHRVADPEGGGTVLHKTTVHDDPHEAADAALDHSARQDSPDSIGGATKFKDFDDAEGTIIDEENEKPGSEPDADADDKSSNNPKMPKNEPQSKFTGSERKQLDQMEARIREIDNEFLTSNGPISGRKSKIQEINDLKAKVKALRNKGVKLSQDAPDAVYTDGIELSTIHFNPKAHPRDWRGHFRKAVQALRDPKNPSTKIKLPDGTEITKEQGGSPPPPGVVGPTGLVVKDATGDVETLDPDHVIEAIDGAMADGEFDKGPELATKELSQDAPDHAGDTLPPERDRGTMPLTANLSVESETEETHMPQRTVEEVLAEERARAEALEARLAQAEQQLSLSQGTITAQGEQLHMSSVAAKVEALKNKVPPVLLLAAKKVYEADKPGRQPDADGGMNLSVQVSKPDAEGKPTLEELKLSTPTEIVDYLLSQAPAFDGEQAHQIASVLGNVDNLTLSVDPGAEDSDVKKVGSVEQWERESHPERFKDNGKGERI